MTQEQQILQLLRMAGDRGVSNFELMKIAFQYPARIHSLRHKHGQNIISKHVKDKEWRIILIQPTVPLNKSTPGKAISWLHDDEPSVQQPLF
jgi:hypothetical protein